MKFIKEYLSLILFFILVLIITFYEVYNGSMIFLSGDSLSPIALREGISRIVNETNLYPLWIPWIFSGMPSIHSFINISNLYYPQHLFEFLNKFGLPWIWNFLSHLIFGGFGMYLLLRYLSCKKYSALISSVLFMISPYMVAMTAYGHGSQIMTASYIPIIILMVFKVFKENSLINIGILALLIGLQLQRGHIQIAYYTWMMIGLFTFLYNYNFVKDKIGLNIYLIKKNIYLFISLILGFLLSLNIYLPVLNYLDNSTRSTIKNDSALEYATQWSFSLRESITMIIPYAIGFGGRLYSGDMPFTDYPNYIGVIIFIFAFLGFYKSKLEKEYKFYFLLVIAFSFLISLGHNFLPFYKMFYFYLPYFDKFRVPVYILILFYFSIIVLSSFGIEYVIENIKRNNLFKKVLLISLFLVFVISFVYSYFIENDKANLLSSLLRQDIFNIISLLSILLLSIVFFKKYSVNVKYLYVIIFCICFYDYTRINHEIINPKKHVPNTNILKSSKYLEKYLSKDSIVQFLLNDTDKYRIYDVVGPQNRWGSFNIENVNGYHPAKLSNYNTLIQNLHKKGFSLWPESILKLLNVKYIIMPYDNFNYPGFKKVLSTDMFYFGPMEEYDGRKIQSFIYKYENFYPRLYFSKKIKADSKENIYNNIINENFDPKELSYVDSNEKIDFNIDYDPQSLVEIISWSTDKIEFYTKVSSNQFLIMSEIFYPNGWTLKDSNNKKYEIYNVNGILRGALIPKGNNHFIMSFAPNDVKMGKNISLSIFILLLFALIFIIIKKNKHGNI